VCTSAGGEIKVKTGETLPWQVEVFEPKAGEFWEKIGVPGQSKFNTNCTVIGAPDFTGEIDTLIQDNGVSIGAAPGEMQFFKESQNPNSHNLESALFGPGELEGKVKVQGYGAQELREVKNP
jgi:hypothetical protein